MPPNIEHFEAEVLALFRKYQIPHGIVFYRVGDNLNPITVYMNDVEQVIATEVCEIMIEAISETESTNRIKAACKRAAEKN